MEKKGEMERRKKKKRGKMGGKEKRREIFSLRISKH